MDMVRRKSPETGPVRVSPETDASLAKVGKTFGTGKGDVVNRAIAWMVRHGRSVQAIILDPQSTDEELMAVLLQETAGRPPSDPQDPPKNSRPPRQHPSG